MQNSYVLACLVLSTPHPSSYGECFATRPHPRNTARLIPPTAPGSVRTAALQNATTATRKKSKPTAPIAAAPLQPALTCRCKCDATSTRRTPASRSARRRRNASLAGLTGSCSGGGRLRREHARVRDPRPCLRRIA